MELEFSRDSVIGRLKKMQKIFGSGQVINPSRLQNQMMDMENFALAKQFHKQLQAQNRVTLNEADALIKKVSAEKESFRRKVEIKLIVIATEKPV